MFAIVFPFLGYAMNMIILFPTYVNSYQSKNLKVMKLLLWI